MLRRLLSAEFERHNDHLHIISHNYGVYSQIAVRMRARPLSAIGRIADSNRTSPQARKLLNGDMTVPAALRFKPVLPLIE